jgi:hypothetical protein
MSTLLTYKDIRHPDFGPAIKKLAQCAEFKNVALLLKVAKSYKVIVEAEKDCVAVQQKLLTQHGTRQEDGSFKIINLEQFEKDNEELLKTEVLLETDPYKINDLLPAKLHAADISALGPLVAM